MVAPRNLEEPLLLHSVSNNSNDSTGRELSFFERHFGTDAQRSAWIIWLVVLIVFVERCYIAYSADRYFLSVYLYVLALALGVVGCWIFVKSSYPEQIVLSCFYSNEAITPPEGAWCFTVHCGTRVLRGGQLQMLAAILYCIASAVWIQEDYLYRMADGLLSGSDDTWEYMDIVFSSFLLIAGAYYQLCGQYPNSVLAKRNAPRRSVTGLDHTSTITDLQLSGWYFEVLAVLSLLQSAVAFDWSTEGPPLPGEEEPSSVPFSEYNWFAFGTCWLSLLFALGAYFILVQAYKEGSRMDAVLVQQANAAVQAAQRADLEQPLSPSSRSGPRVSEVTPRPVVNAKAGVNPLCDLPDLTDSKTVLRRARRIVNEPSQWIPQPGFGNMEISYHRDTHAVQIVTSVFRSVDPLLLAAVVQSDTFKKFQLRSATGSSVAVVGKLLASQGVAAAPVYHERFPPNPPMPAHESFFASLLHESSSHGTAHHTYMAEVVEWAIPPIAQGPRASFAQQNMSELHPSASNSNGVVHVRPFRYIALSEDGTMKATVWLEDIARWMPEFLLKAEMAKVPLLVEDISRFLQTEQEKLALVDKGLNTWIWQRIHNSISPLAAAVLVRTSPAYRVLLAKLPGLRTKVPEPVSVPVGALGHPLDHFPQRLVADGDIDVAIATKHGNDFVSNEFGAWHSSESDTRQKPGRPKITVWRQEMEGEKVRPFRIQARIHGVDPLTLALLIHRNKLNELVERSMVMRKDEPDPFQSRLSVEHREVNRRLSTPEKSVNASGLGSMIGDAEHGAHMFTVSNKLVQTLQHGAVRVYSEKKRRTKFMPGARDREFTFASVMKDVTPLKAVVVHFGVDDAALPSPSGDVVKLRRFHAWALENDGGTDTKLTWAGLLPVGGRTERLSAWVSSGADIKEKAKFVERLVNIFTSDPVAKEVISECHQFISYHTVRTAMHRELKKLTIGYLQRNSQDYRTLLSEIQPVAGGIVGFGDDAQATGERAEHGTRKYSVEDGESEQSSSSVATVPLSPVESHLRLSANNDDEEDDDSETRTQFNGELEEDHDVIPDERHAK